MKPSKFTILFLTATIAGLAGVYVLISAQAAQQRQAIEARIADREKSAEQMRRATAGFADVQSNVANLSGAVTAIESRLVSEHDLDRVVKEIWQLADANSLETRLIQPMPIHQVGSYSEQPVELDVAGDFGAFYTFMLQIERMPRLVRVLHMDMHRLPDGSGSMSARLTIGIFYTGDTARTGESTEVSDTAAATPP